MEYIASGGITVKPRSIYKLHKVLDFLSSLTNFLYFNYYDFMHDTIIYNDP